MNEINDKCGLFQGPSDKRTFTYSLKLYMERKYHIAGQAVLYSVAHGGPGLPVLSEQVFKKMVGMQCHWLQEIECLTDVEARNHILKV